MAERFEMAAARHLRVAQALEQAGEFDDAAYHFGVCGENATKHALQDCGLQNLWATTGIKPSKTPMRQHFPDMHAFIAAAQADIALNASGRLSSQLQAEVQNGNFAMRFAGWNIDIRYADDTCTPVPQHSCRQWGVDAEELCLAFLV